MTEVPWTADTLEVGGRTIFYHRTGGDRPPLVLLHGLSDDGLCWTRVARDLEPAFDIVMPDARGHGRSSPLRDDGFTLPDLVADVAALMSTLGLRDAIVFGHSMGAITAVLLAAEHPALVRQLVLEDPPFDVAPADPVVRRASFASDIEHWRTIGPSERDEPAAVRHPGWHDSEVRPWVDAKVIVDLAILDRLDVFDDVDWREALAKVSAPGLLLTGEPSLGALISDNVLGDVAELWRAGSVVRVPASGHCVHRDQWNAAIGHVRDALLAENGAAFVEPSPARPSIAPRTAGRVS